VSPALPREERDAIRARAEAATDGPWSAYGTVIAAYFEPNCGGCSGIVSPAHEPSCGIEQIAQADAADAEFIAHARTDVPALLDALDAAEAEIERLRATCGLDRDDKHPCIRVEAYLRLKAERDAARAEVAALRGRIEAMADEWSWATSEGFEDADGTRRTFSSALRALAADEGERKAAARYQEATTPNAGDLSAARQYLDTVRRLDPAMGPLCDEIEGERTGR
jgi:hypothetical protein